MKNRKILIIANGFYPEQTPRAFRATELAKEFCRQGHQVTVMAPHKEGIQPLLNEFPINYINLGKLKWKIPTITGLGKVGALFNKAANRLLPLLFDYPKVELYFKVKNQLKSETQKFDFLISIAVPHSIHWGVAAIWSAKKEENIAPLWIADCGDPYFIQENDTFQPPFYFKWIESWFMRKVDIITVPTNTSYTGYLPEFHNKLVVIPQGFRFEDITKGALLNDGIIRFGYGGAFALNRRDPSELLKFLSKIDKSSHFEFHIFTKNDKFVEAYAAKDDRIILHQPIARTVLLQTLSTFNFVVNFTNTGVSQTPSKLIDYAIIDKPILQINSEKLDGEIVLQFLESNYQNKLAIDNFDNFRIENVVKQFLSLENRKE